MEFERCRDILLRESELVQKVGNLQDMIYSEVVGRDWTDFEAHFGALEEMRTELAALEGERERLFSECLGERIVAGSDGDTADADASFRFYAFVARLSPEQRGEITGIYRSLKVETLKVRSTSETLMSYIAGARATMAGFFDAAFPETRTAKTYSPYGTKVSNDMRSMVLNQRF